MGQFNDAKRDKIQSALGAIGGQLNDLELEFVRLLGASANTAKDGWSQVFDIALIPPGQHNDRASIWLGDQGHNQDQLNDQWHSYWSTTP